MVKFFYLGCLDKCLDKIQRFLAYKFMSSFIHCDDICGFIRILWLMILPSGCDAENQNMLFG